MDSSIEIEERAGEWLAKRDSGEWSEADEAAFQAWLEESTLHVVAFVRLEAAWKQAKRLKALSAGVPPGAVPSPEAWQLAPFFNHGGPSEEVAPPAPNVTAGSRHGNVFRALAATILLAIAGSVAWYVWPTGPAYRTPVGGIASVPMSDGTHITLNTDSKIRVAVTDTERRVELEKGEAFFEVSKDPNRPFIVTVGNRRVVAVGTAFSVRRDEDDDVRVFVTEGRVKIEGEADISARARSEEEKILTLSAGTIARANNAGILVQDKTIPEIESYLSWRTGYLIFRDMALADAVAEFNRYNTRKIVIDDPSVEVIRISGKFRSTQFEAFVRLLEDGFPIRAQSIDDQIVLTDSRKVTETAALAQ